MGYPKKISAVLDSLYMPTLPFPKCLMGFSSDAPMNVPATFEVRKLILALPVPELRREEGGSH